jgi:hypothetical protein
MRIEIRKGKLLITKIILVILVLAHISCSHKKGTQKNSENHSIEISAGITEITFNEEIHDFGVLESGEVVVSTFVLTNVGKNDLLIKDIETDCGCIHVKYPKTVVPPGKTALIEVGFNSSGLFGKQFKSIEIHANCKEPKHLAIFAAVKNENLEIKY